MRTLKEAAWVGVLLPAVAVVAPADAGPNWVEGMCSGGGAGATPAFACSVNGSGPLASISGSLSLVIGPAPPDLEDMYLINITDASVFSATTVDPSTTFDTQLWLFGLDELGRLANDDISAVEDASMLGPMSDDGTGIVIAEGLYYLAISGGAGLGVPDPGRFPVAGMLPIFDLVSPSEISGPDGPGGMFAIDGWMGEGAVGNYVIHLEGVSFVPAPGAAGALALGLLAIRRRRSRMTHAPAARGTARLPRIDQAARTRR